MLTVYILPLINSVSIGFNNNVSGSSGSTKSWKLIFYLRAIISTPF
jgi:hypothetical protein